MGNSKPNMEVRKPPADDPDEDKVAAFIEGDNSADDEQTDQADTEESRQTERIAIYFDEATAKKLRMYAAAEGRPMSRIVDEMVAGELEEWAPEF